MYFTVFIHEPVSATFQRTYRPRLDFWCTNRSTNDLSVLQLLGYDRHNTGTCHCVGVVQKRRPQKWSTILDPSLPICECPYKRMTGYKTPAVWQHGLTIRINQLILSAAFACQHMFHVIIIHFTVAAQFLCMLMKCYIFSCLQRNITKDESV